MLKKLWEVTAMLFTLAQDLQRFRQEQKEIRNELRDLAIIVHALSQEFKHSKEQAASEHARLLIELENRLLKYERALSPGTKKFSKKGAKR
ncbi:MAG: hypothetical protein M3416_03860 [Acidobacteriota bacterium]|nr:hypothetical protein [Acidobacteriota bacterium]